MAVFTAVGWQWHLEGRSRQKLCTPATDAPDAPDPVAMATTDPTEQQPTLSKDQAARFEEDGYVELPNFYSPAAVAGLRRWAEAFETCCDPTTAFPGIVSKRVELDAAGWSVPNRVENFVASSPFFGSLVPRLERLVGQLFDDGKHPANLYKEKIVYKRPGGNGYAPHYDGPSCALPGLASKFITVEIAIDDQTVENGCLEGVFPKDQCPDVTMTIVPPVAGGNPDLDGRAGAIDDATAALLTWTAMPSNAGSITLFNHWFPHRSGKNRSKATRRTGFLLFNSAREGDQHAAHAAYASAQRVAYRQAQLDIDADVAAAVQSGMVL